MSASSSLTLFVALALLAALPSLSVLTVISRTVSLGFRHGALTALGIVAGDAVFIAIAIGGLALLIENNRHVAPILTDLGGVYLIVLGISLYRAIPRDRATPLITQSSLGASFGIGLAITLGDQKAALFYLGFLPAFVDLSTLTRLDSGIILLTAAIAVGGVKLIYAALAHRVRSLLNPQNQRRLNAIAASMLVAIGVYLILKPYA